MTIVGLTAALLIIVIGGLGLTLALRPCKHFNLAELCALSWFFGTGLISLLLWIGGLFFSGVFLQSFVAILALGLGIVVFSQATKERISFVFPYPRSLIEWILLITITVQFGIIFWASFSSGLGWDGLLNWEIKARYAFLNHGVMPAQYFSDTSRDFTHQAYPPWIPLTEVWLYLWMGEAHQFWAKCLFAPFYCAGTILLIIIACRLTSRRWIGLLTGALIFFVPCLTTKPGGAQLGYVDVPIAMLYLAAIGYLLLAGEGNDPFSWRIYALSLSLLPWAKREGFVLWAIGAGCGLFVVWRAKRSLRDLLWLVPGPLTAVFWKIFYSSMGKTGAFEYLPMTIPTLMKNAFRLPIIGQRLIADMIDVERWSIFWPIALIALVSLLWRNRDRRFCILFVATVTPICVYAFLYVFSGWPNWNTHIQQSLSRLLLHVMPLLWLTVALALRPPELRQDGVGSPEPSDP